MMPTEKSEELLPFPFYYEKLPTFQSVIASLEQRDRIGPMKFWGDSETPAYWRQKGIAKKISMWIHGMSAGQIILGIDIMGLQCFIQDPPVVEDISSGW